jgi:hypothetical protein
MLRRATIILNVILSSRVVNECQHVLLLEQFAVEEAL